MVQVTGSNKYMKSVIKVSSDYIGKIMDQIVKNVLRIHAYLYEVNIYCNLDETCWTNVIFFKHE